SQHFGRPRRTDRLRSGVRDQPGQHGETSSLLKIQKLAGCGGAHRQSQILGRLRQENRLNPRGGGCSEPRSCHCTPAWARRVKLCQKKKKKKRKEREREKRKKKEKTEDLSVTTNETGRGSVPTEVSHRSQWLREAVGSREPEELISGLETAASSRRRKPAGKSPQPQPHLRTAFGLCIDPSTSPGQAS
uniref:Uncharacterized protein n=1 Tax=Papio anubis TaxID=9555 RepID=A0A8I5NFI2_PAPAN